MDHTKNTLNVSIVSEISSDSIGENWGFRDLQIDFFMIHVRIVQAVLKLTV